MEKTDLVKLNKTAYTARKAPALVQIEAADFLSIEGKGDPDGEEFARHIQALYVAAYAVKFSLKSKGRDFAVPKLEGQWWFDEKKFGITGMAEAPQQVPRNQWSYRLLLRMPEGITAKEVEKCIEQVRAKKQLTILKEVKLIHLHEGDCVQVMHVGPFSEEPKTLAMLNQFIQENNLERNGLHHEIYLSDFRKTSPEKLKTILREPVKRKQIN